MIRNEISTVIDAPVDKVWAYVTDPDNWSQWSASKVPPKAEFTRPIGVGSVITITTHLMGKRTLSGTITDWEPGRKFAFRSNAMGADITEVWSVDQVEGNKTKLTKSSQVQIGGFMRLFQWYLSSKTKEIASTQFAKIKQNMDAKNTPVV